MSARDPLEVAVDLRRRGEPGALCTVTRVSGSAPAREAMRMAVRADGSFVGTVGGGRFEEEVRRAALRTMEDEACRTLAFELTEDDEAEPGLVCGGTLEVFVEPLTVPRLAVLGAGHLGRAVAGVAGPAGFRVTVADDRPSHATRDRFPGAAEVLARPWEEAFERLHAPVGLEVGARTHQEIAVAVVAEMIAVRRTGASPRPAGTARLAASRRGAKAGKA